MPILTSTPKDGNLEYVLTEEGRLVPDGVDQFKPEYYFRDHLGNVRVIYGKDTDGDVEILEEHHYYPFGMTFADLDYYNTPKNPYLYQSKQFIDEYDLNWHYFDARMFDSQLGRWHVIDPIMQFASPYIGMGNNPVSLVDPFGTSVGGDDEFLRKIVYKKARRYRRGSIDPWGSYEGGDPGYWGVYDVGGGGSYNYSGSRIGGSGGLNKSGGSWRSSYGKSRSNKFPDYLYDRVSKTPTKRPTITDQINALKGEISNYDIASTGGGDYQLGDVYNDPSYPQSGRLDNDLTVELFVFAGLRVAKTIRTLIGLKPGQKYDPRLNGQKDLYHNYPRSFDSKIISNGSWSQRISDGANFYRHTGYINGEYGTYEIIMNNQGVIFHRNFTPGGLLRPIKFP